MKMYNNDIINNANNNIRYIYIYNICTSLSSFHGLICDWQQFLLFSRHITSHLSKWKQTVTMAK